MTHECPLCNTDFEETNCHEACPFSKGCAMIRCPRCGYEFVEHGWLARLFERKIDHDSSAR